MQPGDQGPAGGVDGVLGAGRAGRDDRRDAFAVHHHVDADAVDLGVADDQPAHDGHRIASSTALVSRPSGAARPAGGRHRGAATSPSHAIVGPCAISAPTRGQGDVEQPPTAGEEAVDDGDGANQPGGRVGDRIGAEHGAAAVPRHDATGDRGVVAEAGAHVVRWARGRGR